MSESSGIVDARLVQGLAVEIPHEPADAVVSGDPHIGVVELGTFGGVELGIWEITPGVVTDTETDEVFVVLEGDGTVSFEDGSEIVLAPGAIVRLREGERTRWTIRTRLRKVYLA